MKKLLFVLAFAFIGQQAFSQVYIITEKHDGLNGQIPTFDSVFVTNPLGVTITHSIPHIFESIIDHNSAFNLILNNVINSGYKIVTMHPFEAFLVPNQGSNFYALRTIYLGIPWNTSDIEEVAMTLKSFIISPNPANTFVDVSLDYSLKGGSEVVFISEAGYISHKESIGEILKNEKYNIDISKIPAGKYLVTIVNGKTYTTPQKLIVL
jgi:hypothetical protein